MKRNKKDKTKEYIDDGQTFYNMDVDGLPKRETKQNLNLNRKERNAVIKAALVTYLPMYLAVVACFAVAVILLYLWLK